MSELANAEIVNLFASPVISYRWPDSDELNKELRQRVLAREREYPGRSQSKSTVGGWHSQTGQLEFGATAGNTLLRRATELVNEVTRQVLTGRQVPPFNWRPEAPANVNRPGDALEITDPCQARATTFFPAFLPPGIFIRPEPGLMVLFPSYMPHVVFPHRGKRPRISIAINFPKEPLP